MNEAPLQEIAQRARKHLPPCDFWTLRLVREQGEEAAVRSGVAMPPSSSNDCGVMFTVYCGDGVGYGATSDLTDAGLKRAASEAQRWALAARGKTVTDFSRLSSQKSVGHYKSPRQRPWQDVSLAEKFDLLKNAAEVLAKPNGIADSLASLHYLSVEQIMLTAAGSEIAASFCFVFPFASATAHANGESQTRTFGGFAHCRQGGYELIEELGFLSRCHEIPEEALAILAAENCPTKTMSVVLSADQMILQIHESIGHPLELDRILGDERNYAGTSFVTKEMFGNYQYGSDLLNVTYDPSVPSELASSPFDDEGLEAKREFLIKEGILLRGLGGTVSQLRLGMPGVANSRAEGWSRPPIDRMANLNLEPHQSSLAEMIAAVEDGIYMKTNSSWSIDDSRNKFQFSCEWGQLIENGKLTRLVRNPNYRGISANFWRNLAMVGDRSTFEILGTPHCGKGEPNQVIRVGHATPACMFRDVSVFGGES